MDNKCTHKNEKGRYCSQCGNCNNHKGGGFAFSQFVANGANFSRRCENTGCVKEMYTTISYETLKKSGDEGHHM